MKVVAHPFDTPLGPGVCKAPTEEELRTQIYSPEVLSRLGALLRDAAAKVAAGSLEARRIALFRREYLEPLHGRFGAPCDRKDSVGLVGSAPRADRNGL